MAAPVHDSSRFVPGSLDPYVPRVLMRRLVQAPERPVESAEATALFADVSGFTKLSERLARRGTEGAEHLSDAIGSCFEALLADAYANGGSLLKFGGDALLLYFEGPGHAERACRSAVDMRRTLRTVGRIRAGSSTVTLRISMGLHTGVFDLFLVGTSHRELIVAGPAASAVVAAEAAARTGQILMSPATAARLPPGCVGDPAGPGFLLRRAPAGPPTAPEEELWRPPDERVADCLSTEVRAHVRSGPHPPTHRTVTVAFVHYAGMDRLIAAEGAAAAAAELAELVTDVQEAADRYQVCLLGSDVAADGGKLILTAGAPRSVGDDEERMLLALRSLVERRRRLAVSAGVHRGPVFAGDIGPSYRRTYTVMGDAVNVAARLMARAPHGEVYATRGVLARSRVRFQAAELEPFLVKGKARPVEACSVGGMARQPIRTASRLPSLVGRENELAVLREAVESARAGVGQLVDLVGDGGSGKTRILAEVRKLMPSARHCLIVCEAYTAATPYAAIAELTRQLLGVSATDGDAAVLEHLRADLERNAPDLVPWLPMIAIVLGVEAPSTPEVDAVGEANYLLKQEDVMRAFVSRWAADEVLIEIHHGHLMDAASARLIRALAENIDRTRWVCVISRRDVGTGYAPGAAPHRRIELGRLPDDALARLADEFTEARPLPPHVVRTAIRRSDGNPEFLLDMLAFAAEHGGEELPDGASAAARAFIDQLDPRDRALVRRASVLGVSFHLRELDDVLDGAPDDATWHRLRSVFAIDDNGQVRFRRELVRDVAYGELAFRARRSLHAAVAAHLLAEPDPDHSLLCLHFDLAGDSVGAYRHGREAARRATAQYAYADAAQLFRRAISAGRDSGAPDAELAELWEGLGESLRRSGEPTAAGRALTTARSLRAGDVLAQARLLHIHARMAESVGHMASAVRWTTRGLRLLEGRPDQEAIGWRARFVCTLALLRLRQGRGAEAVGLCRRAMADAEAAGELNALANACFLLDWALFESGGQDEAVYSERALAIYRELGDPAAEAIVLNNMGGFAYVRGDWDAAVRYYRLAADCDARAGSDQGVVIADTNVGEVLSDQGRLSEAEEHLRRARRVARGLRDERDAAFAELLLGRALVRDGRHDEGIGLIRASHGAFVHLHTTADAALARAYLAEAEALGGDPAAARAMVAAQRARHDASAALWARADGFARFREGDLAGAWAAFAESVALARDKASGTSAGEYDVLAGLDALERLADRLGRPDPARAAERAAIMQRLDVVSLPFPASG